jgi:DNA replication and repair protein RecF
VTFVKKLQLTNFRCYEQACLNELQGGLVCIYGPNGAGKTNILEALSYLSPGRGLRGARIEELRNSNVPVNALWSVSAVVNTLYGDVRIGTGSDAGQQKRVVRVNAEPLKAQSALSEYLSCVWLTPQMDRLFLDGATERRRFLDRLIFAFDAGHAGRLTRYENAMRQRSKLLTQSLESEIDESWLSSLEQNMAETGTAIAAARIQFLERLQEACDQQDDKNFPQAILAVTGVIEELLTKIPAVEAEQMFAYQLKKTRTHDAALGRTSSGVHRSDLLVNYKDKNMPAAQCSTGEQKALLIGLILAHALLIGSEKGAPPLILLDEVSAHLDENRRASLYELLSAIGAQVFMTGTDKMLFSSINSRARFLKVVDSCIIDSEQNIAA